MKERLLDLIVCPQCKSRFGVKAAVVEKREYAPEWRDRVCSFWASHRHGGDQLDPDRLWQSYCTEIVAGSLVCTSCGVEYAIEGGVPRILDPALRTTAGGMGRGRPTTDTRIDQQMDEIAPVPKDTSRELFDQIQLANQSNYGYEWKAFKHQYDQWETVYKESYVAEDDAYFGGRLGLDAGCGMGRYSLVPVQKGAEVVGVDLSNAIEAAYEKAREIPTFHAIQGDIFNLPFTENYFDFAQSLGVIHITPDPEGALRSILNAVRPNGKVFLMVYQTFEDENLLKHSLLKVVNFMRRLTVRLPSNVLYTLLYFMVPVVLVTCYFPSWILWHLGLRSLATALPYNYKQYGRRRFRDIHMNLFDRFGNPVERRYNRKQMETWMTSAGFQSYELRAADGWMVAGVKPQSEAAPAESLSCVG
jgi:SAM-dependent methyltransferase/uncharacterized protein YbaR (Trm112 family)